MTATAVQPYIDLFGRLESGMPGGRLPWLAERRRAGLERFRDTGFPSVKAEAWKYTNLRPLESLSFDLAAPSPPTVGIDRLPTVMPAGESAYRLVFVDGAPRPDLGLTSGLPVGVVLMSLGEALEKEPALLEEYLGRVAPVEDGKPLAALNTAFLADGAVLRLPKGVVLDKPVELLFLATGADRPLVWHPRLLIVAETLSEATIVEHHVGLGGGTYFANSVTEVVARGGARLRHYKLQREGAGAFHVATVAARLERDVDYSSFVLAMGAKLARHEACVTLDGPGINAHVSAGYLVRDSQHCDITTVIDHAQPHGSSRQVCKGVLDDTARAVFQGKIVVRPGAQKTDGYQINRALLLSEKAEVDTKPELEIYADDVKCSHGATAGELDDDALFYLRARGIDRDTARGLLIGAFLGEALEEVGVEVVRNAFAAQVEGWLAAREAKL
ncbi:MAG TPA: Fe-S cluster assembly protein SufD [Azospirillaceae bacterium]|nr:Fe-S cluster assembly protein SufD [Azospirillaceae bacterium]